jgi:hypothetical protein
MSPDEPRDDGMPDFSGVTGGASTSAKAVARSWAGFARPARHSLE